MKHTPVGGDRGVSVRGQKTKQLRELSAVSPPLQAPGGRRQRQVFDAFSDLHCAGMRPCDSDVAEHLHLSISWIVPRRRELYELGHLICGGQKRVATGRTVNWWRPASTQLDLFARVPQ